MNKHFEDTRYYVKRAGETMVRGVREELAPLVRRYEKLTGDDEEPAGRLAELEAELWTVRERAETEAREMIGEARAKLAAYRTA